MIHNSLIRFTAAAAVFTLFSMTQSGADIIAQDDFSYTLGQPLAGQNGGSGWGGGWVTDANISGVVSGTTYDYKVGGGGTVRGGSAGLLLYPNPGKQVLRAVYRPLAEAYSGDEVFVSFLLRQEGGAIVNNDRIAVWLGDGVNAAGPLGGMYKSSAYDFYVRPNGSGKTSGSLKDGFAMETTYLVVLRFNKSVSGEGNIYDQASIWVNPSVDDLQSPSASSPVSLNEPGYSISSFNTIGLELRSGSDQNDNSYYFDQLTIGSTWADVVPAIPESSAYALGLAAGSVAALLWRRHRKAKA